MVLIRLLSWSTVGAIAEIVTRFPRDVIERNYKVVLDRDVALCSYVSGRQRTNLSPCWFIFCRLVTILLGVRQTAKLVTATWDEGARLKSRLRNWECS